MNLYLDVVFIINFIFDFTLLETVNIILKRKISIIKIIIGSLIGSLSLLTLFIRLNPIELFLFKTIIITIINYLVFSYKNIRYFITNLYYIFLVSIVLGGIMYLIRNNNYILTVFLSLIFIYYFVKNISSLKNNYNKYFDIKININNKYLKINAFLDTGNKLVDPYFKRPIILINKRLIKDEGNIIVPYNNNQLLNCIPGKELCIDGKKINKKYLIGLIDNINIDGVDCIFNERLMEEI